MNLTPEDIQKIERHKMESEERQAKIGSMAVIFIPVVVFVGLLIFLFTRG